jgi:hypothetical protein
MLTDIYASVQYLNLYKEVFSHLPCRDISCLFMESGISKETIMGPLLSCDTGIQFHIAFLRYLITPFKLMLSSK